MTTSFRQPTLYISHGGGPCFWMPFHEPIGEHGFDKLRQYLTGIIPSLPKRPEAILAVSAHWECSVPTVSIAPSPPMLFDYYGFPEHTYRLSYPAPGYPEMASRIKDILEKTGIAAATDAERGFDHGVFVPLMMIDPEASIPVIMLSLQEDLDPELHISIGKSLASLRAENVLIVGSGNSYHNLRDFFDGREQPAGAFDAWLHDVVTNTDASIRNTSLRDWIKAPYARACHPREEHLLPLMVVAGAGGDDKGRCTFRDMIGGKAISCFGFGISS